jgi:hypothetical protein
MSINHGALNWRTSTYCGTGTCVQVATASEMTYVRDSKGPSGGVLAVPNHAWTAFLNEIRSGHLDNLIR